MAVWDEALRSAKPNSPLVWTHGDLFSTNLLINRGELSAVIDFGDFGLGDPACDLLPAWGLFSVRTEPASERSWESIDPRGPEVEDGPCRFPYLLFSIIVT